MADIYVNHTGDNTTGQSEATAYNDLQTAINNGANGDKIWIKIDGIYYIGVPVDVSPNASYTNGRLIEAYYQSPGDCRRGQPYFGYRAVFDGQGLAMNCFDYISSEWVLANLHATNVNGYLFNFGTAGYHRTLINCSGDETGHSSKYQLYSGYSYLRLIMVDCHFINNYDNIYARGYAFFLKNCWIQNTNVTYNTCIKGSSCYSFSAHNCAFISRYDGGARYCLDHLYALHLTNCIIKGQSCITCNSSIFNHILAVNNYFASDYKVLNCSYGAGGLFDYNATNMSNFGTHKMAVFGEHNLPSISFYDNFVDWDNNDFRLQKNSVLKDAGQPILVGSDGTDISYDGTANIGPYIELPKPTPQRLFIQGG